MAQKTWGIFKRAYQNKRVRQLIYIGLVGLSLLFIAYLIYANWSALKDQEWHINVPYILLAIFLFPLGYFPTIAGWHYILKAFNVSKPFLLNLRLYALSSLPKHIPGLIWYVTSRTLLYEEHAVKVSVVLSATAIETALLALSGFISAVSLVPIQAKLPVQFEIIRFFIPLSIVILLLIIIFAPGGSFLLEKLMRRLMLINDDFRLNRQEILKSITWLFIAWVGGGILLWIVVRSMTAIDYKLLPYMIGIWGVAGAVSLTIGLGIQGLGLREVTLGALLSLVIIPIKAFAIAIAFRLILTVGELLWVVLISLFVKDNPKISEKSPEV